MSVCGGAGMQYGSKNESARPLQVRVIVEGRENSRVRSSVSHGEPNK